MRRYIISEGELANRSKTIGVLDENECLLFPCRKQASCINNNGSFECICKDGFTGNGSYCEGNDRQGKVHTR